MDVCYICLNDFLIEKQMNEKMYQILRIICGLLFLTGIIIQSILTIIFSGILFVILIALDKEHSVHKNNDRT